MDKLFKHEQEARESIHNLYVTQINNVHKSKWLKIVEINYDFSLSLIIVLYSIIALQNSNFFYLWEG